MNPFRYILDNFELDGVLVTKRFNNDHIIHVNYIQDYKLDVTYKNLVVHKEDDVVTLIRGSNSITFITDYIMVADDFITFRYPIFIYRIIRNDEELIPKHRYTYATYGMNITKLTRAGIKIHGSNYLQFDTCLGEFARWEDNIESITLYSRNIDCRALLHKIRGKCKLIKN